MKLSNSPIVKLWPYLLAFAFWALLIDLSIDSCENSSLKKENEQLRYDLAHAQIHVPPERFYIHDTVEVVKQQVQVVERLKPVLTDEDRALLKDLKLKLNNVESMQHTGIENHGSVTLHHPDTLPEPRDGYLSRDSSVLSYKDRWCDFTYDPTSRNLNYAVRDSLRTIVSRRYKHRFLWWRWGVKGYDIHIVNFNPHATVTYNGYVRHK